MEFKGTKGKWEKVHTKIQVEPQNPMRTLTICQVFGGDEESLANAKLIAAAPELLEAALEVLKVWNEDGEGGEIQMKTPIAWHRPLRKAEKAIKKALGGE